MNTYASSQTAEDLEGRIEDWMNTASQELRHAVAYVDTVVVPEVRHEAANALRALAGHLDRLADKLDPAGKRGL